VFPGEELPREILRDRTALDQTGEQALAEQLHHRLAAPAREGMEAAIVRKDTVGQEKVSVGVPLNQVSGSGDGHDDAGPSVRAERPPHVLGYGLRGALREVEQQLPPLAEDPAQEARHGEDDVAMWNGREHFLLQPFRPQELALLFARRAKGPSAARERSQHARPARGAPKPREAM
jgi:hypothetical protein